MSLHERIKSARNAVGLSQEDIGELFEPPISRAAVAQWERAPDLGGTAPEQWRLPMLAAALKRSVDWLLTGQDSVPFPKFFPEMPNLAEPNATYGRVPLISWVSAGSFDEANDPFEPGDARRWEDTASHVSQRAFALEVRGDSMEPRFPEGCVIVVEPARTPKPRDFVVVRSDKWDEATFKQFVVDGGQRLLKPLNSRYPIMIVEPGVRFCGVVIEKIDREKF